MSNHDGKWMFYDCHIYIYVYIYVYYIYVIYIMYMLYMLYILCICYICYIYYIYQKSNILINIILSIIPSPLFIFVSQCYHAINWLKRNLKTHFVWYLCKEIRSDTGTWSTDNMVFSKEHFHGENIQKICTKS